MGFEVIPLDYFPAGLGSTPSLYLGMDELPLPDADGGINVDSTPIAVKRRMYSGEMRVDHTAVKHKITMRWTLLTAAEWETLVAIYEAYVGVPAMLNLPNGDNYYVVIADNVLARQGYDDPYGTWHYSTSMVLEEV
jgi:hypothetical protein